MDLLRLDLFTGEGASTSSGAAPTYVRRGGSVSRVTGCALPRGPLHRGAGGPDVSRLQLEPGDVVVLVSDGVTDRRDDQWLRAALSAFNGESPKDLARSLVSPGEGETADDDRTALVVRVDRRQA